jgi:hypothetical protein
MPYGNHARGQNLQMEATTQSWKILSMCLQIPGFFGRMDDVQSFAELENGKTSLWS